MKSKRHISGGESCVQKEKGRPSEGSPKHNGHQNSIALERLQAIAARHPGNGASAQRARILEALQLAALTTVDCRRWLDCPHPAQRILELRSLGLHIETVWTTAPTESGNRHRFALYTLTPQRGGAA